MYVMCGSVSYLDKKPWLLLVFCVVAFIFFSLAMNWKLKS